MMPARGISWISLVSHEARFEGDLDDFAEACPQGRMRECRPLDDNCDALRRTTRRSNEPAMEPPRSHQLAVTRVPSSTPTLSSRAQ